MHVQYKQYILGRYINKSPCTVTIAMCRYVFKQVLEAVTIPMEICNAAQWINKERTVTWVCCDAWGKWCHTGCVHIAEATAGDFICPWCQSGCVLYDLINALWCSISYNCCNRNGASDCRGSAGAIHHDFRPRKDQRDRTSRRRRVDTTAPTCSVRAVE